MEIVLTYCGKNLGIYPFVAIPNVPGMYFTTWHTENLGHGH